jgi:uncharacterized membrane protein
MDMLEGETKVRDYNLERLIMLTDGVFAIAITLLAIDLRPPADWDGRLVTLVNETYREFIAYVMSFFFIAVYWASHRRTYKRFKRADGVLTALNFVLLALVTLIPFGTSLLTASHLTGEPLMIYLGLVIAIGVANALQWGYAAFIARDLLDSKMGWPLRLLIFLILLILPSLMASMSFVANRPQYTWLYGVMIVMVIGVFWLRRIAGKAHDG